ncbi:DUF58 domain-containing protein [Peribacillus tepidiphilus]|uniref:DUF58 domain-containing protein n=1 Tax=Peribacillus tepidiphilus TaxID=2652445 RepID=UPI0035B4FF49
MKQIFVKMAPYTKLLALIFLTVAAFVYAMFQGGFVSWFLFYSFLPFSVYSLLLFFYLLRDFQVKRSIQLSQCKAGEELTIHLTLTRKFSFPLFYLIVEDVLPEKLSEYSGSNSHAVLFPWFRKELSLSYKITNLIRGEHIFQDVSLKTGDLLGLVKKTLTLTSPGKILVLPQYENVNFKQLEAYYEQGQMACAIKMKRETIMVSGVRDYQPGDRLSWINWKATAKKNEIMTKEFEERKSQDVLIILDQKKSPVFEEMISIAASLAHSIIKKGIQTGLIGTVEMEKGFQIRGGETQKQKILNWLAKIEDRSEVTFNKALEGRGKYFPSNLSFIIITSQLNRNSLNWFASFKANRPATIYFVTTDSLQYEEMRALKETAALRGIHLQIISPGEWKQALAEVKRG